MSHHADPAMAERTPDPASDGHVAPTAQAPIWNVFRRRDEKDLWCAVPCDRSVPGFLFSGEWTFSGIGGRNSDSNLVAPEARLAVQLNGFYLFMSFSQNAGLSS